MIPSRCSVLVLCTLLLAGCSLTPVTVVYFQPSGESKRTLSHEWDAGCMGVPDAINPSSMRSAAPEVSSGWPTSGA
jgi:hypothetical protein